MFCRPDYIDTRLKKSNGVRRDLLASSSQKTFLTFLSGFYIRQDSVPQYYGAARVQCMEYFSYYSIKVMYRLKTTTARAGYSSFSHL